MRVEAVTGHEVEKIRALLVRAPDAADDVRSEIHALHQTLSACFPHLATPGNEINIESALSKVWSAMHFAGELPDELIREASTDLTAEFIRRRLEGSRQTIGRLLAGRSGA